MLNRIIFLSIHETLPITHLFYNRYFPLAEQRSVYLRNKVYWLKIILKQIQINNKNQSYVNISLKLFLIN